MANALTDDQQQTLRQQLQTDYRQLRDTVHRELLALDNERYADLAGDVRDNGDASVADMLVDIDMELFGKHKNDLREIENALSALGSDDFGYCEDCGKPIPFERLEVQPTATRCVEDQERFEQQSGDQQPTL